MQLDCRSCTEDEREHNGCLKDSPVEDVWELDGEVSRRCPVTLVTPESVEYIRAYNFFQKGYLPNPGGWMDQPAKLIEAIELIETQVQRIDEEEIKRARRS